MNVTEFQPQKGGGIVTDAIDTGDKLIELIKQVVSVDGRELSQIRLAEILIKIIQLAGLGTVIPPTSSVPISVNIGFEASTNTVTISVNGISVSIALNETHDSFTGSTIANNSTNKVALQALETALELLPNNAESGVYMINKKVRLGNNPFQENVVLDGATLWALTMQNLKDLYIKNLDAKTTETKILWIDVTTGKIVIGDPPAGGGGGSGYIEYDATDGVRVWASNIGVTADWVSGELTVTIPGGVHLQAFRLSLANGSNVQSGGDAGGATNWIRVKIAGTSGYNTSATDMKIPSVQKCMYAAGAPALNNAYSIDIDNNPNMAVVGVGTNSITIRIWNLIVPNGAQFTFNGI